MKDYTEILKSDRFRRALVACPVDDIQPFVGMAGPPVYVGVSRIESYACLYHWLTVLDEAEIDINREFGNEWSVSRWESQNDHGDTIKRLWLCPKTGEWKQVHPENFATRPEAIMHAIIALIVEK